jgi:hypothetical protein
MKSIQLFVQLAFGFGLRNDSIPIRLIGTQTSPAHFDRRHGKACAMLADCLLN